MKPKILILLGLALLVLVLIGVTVINPIAENHKWVNPFIPIIIFTGFFVFLVAVILFVYGIILLLGGKKI